MFFSVFQQVMEFAIRGFFSRGRHKKFNTGWRSKTKATIETGAVSVYTDFSKTSEVFLGLINVSII